MSKVGDVAGLICNSLSTDSLQGHTQLAKESIPVPIALQNIKATTLIDCGSTDNFINLEFIEKRGLKPIPLKHPITCRLGEGTTTLTQTFHSVVHVGEDNVPMDFYVMNGMFTQGIVRGYGLLACQGVLIDFGSKQVSLKGKQMSCMKKQVVDEPMEALLRVHKIHDIDNIRLWPGESSFVGIRSSGEESMG